MPGRGTDTRRFSLARKNGHFTVRPAFKTPVTCGLLRKAELNSNAFGGSRNAPLGISFRLGEAAQLTAVVKRGQKVVKTFKRKTYQANRNTTLRLKAPKRGSYTVTLTATRAQAQATATLTAKRV